MLPDDGLGAVKAEAVGTGFSRFEQGAHLRLLFPGAVEQIEIEHVALHPQGEADKSVSRCLLAGFDGIIQQIADDDAQLQIGEGQRRRQIRLHRDGDARRPCRGDFCGENGVRRHISGFQQGIHTLQVLIQLLDVGDGAVGLPGLQLPFERLQVVMEVVLVAAHLAVDAPDLLQVLARLLFLHFHKLQIGSFQHIRPSVPGDERPIDRIIFPAGDRHGAAPLQGHAAAPDAADFFEIHEV